MRTQNREPFFIKLKIKRKRKMSWLEILNETAAQRGDYMKEGTKYKTGMFPLFSILLFRMFINKMEF